jgi:hypothetical protein
MSHEEPAPNPVEDRRGYWRSSVVAACIRELKLKETIQYDEQFEAYLIRHRTTLGESLRNLLDTLCEMEERFGQRGPGMFSFCAGKVQAIIISHLQPVPTPTRVPVSSVRADLGYETP